MDIFDKFDKMVDTEALARDAKEAENGDREFEKVPHGEYEVKIDKMEIKESKKGDPMLAVWFKVLNGEYEGNLIFLNQVITKGFQIHLANEILSALCDETIPVEFKTYKQYNDVVCDVYEFADKHEYLLKYSENKKHYDTFEIKEVFDVEQCQVISYEAV